jgi:anti-sigma-K factor RskA
VTPGREDPHTLAGAYAMDAVDEQDRGRFEQHLARCESCRQEVRGLREATAALATATAVEPPAALRDAVLQAVAYSRQAPPVAGKHAGPLPGWHDRLGRSPGRAGRRGPGRWAPRLVIGLAAAAAVVAAVLGLGAYAHMEHRPGQAQGGDPRVAAVLSAPDARMVSGHVSTGGTATVVMSRRMRQLVFTAADLRALPPQKGYELWLIGPSGKRPAGMLAGSEHGRMIGPMVVSGLSAGDRVGLSVEPAGGSPQLTSRLILLL